MRAYSLTLLSHSVLNPVSTEIMYHARLTAAGVFNFLDRLRVMCPDVLDGWIVTRHEDDDGILETWTADDFLEAYDNHG